MARALMFAGRAIKRFCVALCELGPKHVDGLGWGPDVQKEQPNEGKSES